MAVISEAIALLDLINIAQNLVQTIGSGWYKDTQDMQNFAEQVTVLRLKEQDWNSLLKIGPEAQKLVRPMLEAAIEILEKEEASMRHLQAKCWLRCSYRTLNIGAASQAIQSVSQAFERIPETIGGHVLAGQWLNRIATDAIAHLPFTRDKKYVLLRKPLEAVRRALESVGGPRVVTLHGQPGSGKTVMAKYLAVEYDERRRQQQVEPTSLRTARASTCFSDGVFFLACGPGATSKGLYEELWQNLGFRTLFDLDTQGGSTFMPRLDREWYSESMLHKQLMERLVNNSMLIILDDVWETQLLERLLLPGSGLKYLVTSQYKRVWEDAVQINVAKPSLKEARKILVNHVDGLPARKDEGKELPLNLQDVADKIIYASEFNPLVLANLALAISGERATNLDEWITVRKYLLELLDDDEKRPIGYEKTYPRTVASTMTMAVNSMTVETQNLLFLAAVCDGPSVPEIVLKIFFNGLVGSLARFQKRSNYLEDHDFIQILSRDVKWTDEPEKTWSLHLLRQHFVREKKKDEVRSMVSVLFGAKHKDSDIVSALYILYAAKLFTQEIAARISELLNISKDRINQSFARSSIEPFVWLLHVDSNEEWQQNAHEMAKKIIVSYIRFGNLEDIGLSSLLQLPQAQSATCWALYTIAILEQRALLTENHEATLKSLLALLDHEASPTTQSWGAVALGALAVKNHDIILAQPLALKNLLGLVLSSNDDENVQRYATWALGNLAATSTAKDSIANYPGMLEALLKLLNTNDDLNVQLEAAYVLRRLAYGEEITTEGQSRQMKMIALANMLEKLVPLLNRGTDAEVQKEVVWLLGNLAVSHEEKSIIGNYPGVLEGLVAMLDIQDTRFDTQIYHAAYALRRLTLKEPNPKLGRIPGAVECLVELLFAFGKANVQKEATHCLSFLAYPKEHRIELAAIPGALEGLVGLLLESVSPTTQLIATGTLANLVEANENKVLIASEPGAIEGLVRMLRNPGAPPEVRSQLIDVAVQCLGQLSFENHENQLKIASSRGALEGLVELLGGTSSRVQILAVWTLCNLAEADENKLLIASERGAIEGLVRILRNPGAPTEVPSQLSQVAVQCLGQLSFENYENQLKIASSHDCLVGLVQFLGVSNSRVQLLAVWTLSNLAEADENRTRISAVPKAEESLNGLLEAEGLESGIQGYAEKATCLLLNSTAPRKRISAISPAEGSFPEKEPATDNEAIEDLKKDHNRFVPWVDLNPNGLPNAQSLTLT